MIRIEEKISMRQATLLILCGTYSPFMRFVPYFTSKHAHQAAWLCPLISCLFLFLLVLTFDGIYKKYREKEVSFMDIIYNVFGKIIGKIIVLLYLAFSVILHAYFFRYYCERFLSTTYTEVDIKVFIIIMLLLIAVVLKYRIVVFARMAEIIFLILVFSFAMVIVFDIPNINFYNLTPISTNDILPIFKGSIGTMLVLNLYTLIFLFSDKINNKFAIKKIGFQCVLFYTILAPILIMTIIGTLNYSTVQRMSFPYLSSVKEISLFHTIERIESIVVVIWTLSDFVLLTVLAFVNINLIKSLFNLKEEKHLTLIYLSFIFVFVLAFVGSKYELDDFTENITLPLNLTFFFGIPVLTLFIGKLRKRV